MKTLELNAQTAKGSSLNIAGLEDELRNRVRQLSVYQVEIGDFRSVFSGHDESAICLRNSQLQTVGYTRQYAHLADLFSTMMGNSKEAEALLLNGVKRLSFFYEVPDDKMGEVDVQTVAFAVRHEPSAEIVVAEVSHFVPKNRFRGRMNALRNLRDCEQALIPLLCNGYSNKQVAAILQTPMRTIENRRRKILREFGVRSLAEFVKIIVRLEDAGLTHFQI